MSSDPSVGARNGGERLAGELRFPDGAAADGALTLIGDELAVAVGGSEVGRWRLDVCRAARHGDRFRLSIDGDEVDFLPADPDRFARLAANRFGGSTLAERIGIMRASSRADGPAPEPRATAGDGRGRTPSWRVVGRWAGFAASALAAGALAAMLGFGPAGEPPPTVGGGTASSSSVAGGEETDAFALPPEAFADRWNEVAASLGVEERVVGVSGPGSFEARLADRVLLQGTVGVDGTVDAFVVSVDPAGTGEENRVALAAWGVAIAVSEPGLDAPGRRGLLAELGVDVDEPRVADLDGEVERDGRRYSMRYVPDFRTVLFAVEER